MAWRTLKDLPKFNERKATQAAVLLLKRFNAPIEYLKLIKLLYIVERRAIMRWGSLFTCDRLVSMDNGPVLSQTYGLIQEGRRPEMVSYWARFITPPSNYKVRLTETEIPEAEDVLSAAEKELLNEVFEEFGSLPPWELVDITHTLPEWRNPFGSAIPIKYSTLLKEAGKSDEQIRKIRGDWADSAWVDDNLT